MAREKMLLELAIERELVSRNKNETGRALSRTASYCHWIKSVPTSDASLQRLLAHYHEPNSPNVMSWNEHPTLPSTSENRTVQSLIKNGPSADKQSNPINLNSAREDWKNETGPALSRTASFCDWNAAPESDAGVQRLLARHPEPTSPNVKAWNEHPALPRTSENRTVQSLIKNGSSSDKQSNPINLNSAPDDWKNGTGPALSRTASFRDWVNAAPGSDAGQQRLLAHHPEPTSPNVKSWNEHPTLPSTSENRTVRNLIENGPSSDKQSNPINLNSAREDWVGPKKFSEKKFQVHTPKIFPKSKVPTKACFDLKRKVAKDSRIQWLSSSSSSTPYRKMAKTSTDNLVCEICQVTCSSSLTLRQHLIGRPHRAMLEFKKLKRNCNNSRGKPRCEVCQIWCSDRDAMSMHLKGQKHMNKLHGLKKGTGGNNINAKSPILCELCSVYCMNEDCFQMHLKGRQHHANEELKRRGML